MPGVTVADGKIIIDTSIDTKGFNDGMKKVKTAAIDAANTVLLAFLRIATPIRGAFDRVAGAIKNIFKGLLTGLAVLFAVSFQKIFQGIGEELNQIAKGNELEKTFEDLRGQFAELRNAAAVALLPLITFAIPYIKILIEWLVEVLNKVAMITAAFLGQKEVLQTVAGSAKKTADQTKNMEKAARGALAAFDQINVLQQPTTGGGAAGPQPEFTVATQMVPIADDILEKVAKIKKWFVDTWDFLVRNWGIISDWWKTHVSEPIARWWGIAWTNIKNAFTSAWDYVSGAIRNTIPKLVEMWERVKLGATTAWMVVSVIWSEAIGWFKTNVIDPWITLFKDVWKALTDDSTTVVEKFIQVWTIVSEWFKMHITDPIRDAFGNALNWLADKFILVFTGIYNFIKGIFNNVIDIINGVLAGVAAGINSIIGNVNSVGALVPGIPAVPTVAAVKIPHLATGAVIPPNSQFAAILGDQRSGKNLEAPESLIRKIINEEIGNIKADISIQFTGSMASFVRELKPQLERETIRVGRNLVAGKVVTK